MSSSPTPSKILLFGATGVIGKFILEQLIDASPAFKKIGIFTSPGTAQSKGEDLAKFKDKGVEVVVGDVNSESDVKRAFEGVFRLAFLAQYPAYIYTWHYWIPGV
jgi:uncharacterized protein YbjT (DUF2867 family)